jgi:hypothetical protein
MRAADLLSDDWDGQLERPGYTWARRGAGGALGGESPAFSSRIAEYPDSGKIVAAAAVHRRRARRLCSSFR